jgi:Tfp pilus assembly protein PilV
MNETIKVMGEVVVVIIGALGVAGIIIRVRRTKNSTNNSKIVQKRNIVGGDQAGRDIHK